MSKKFTVILVIAAPGAGKTTQCALIARQFQLVHISIGELLRSQRKKDNQFSKQLNQYMTQFQQSGTLMPCDFIQKILVKKMNQIGPEKHIFLIDGYIKSKTMYHYWDQTIGDNCNLLGVIYYQCSKQVLIERLQKRIQSQQREDDRNSKLAQIRIQTFYRQTYQVVEIFKSKGVVKIINGEGCIEEVGKDSLKTVSQMGVKIRNKSKQQ